MVEDVPSEYGSHPRVVTVGRSERDLNHVEMYLLAGFRKRHDARCCAAQHIASKSPDQIRSFEFREIHGQALPNQATDLLGELLDIDDAGLLEVAAEIGSVARTSSVPPTCSERAAPAGPDNDPSRMPVNAIPTTTKPK